MTQKQFELTEDHIKLLKNMYVNWSNTEFGAPRIDPKKPYGNSTPLPDMADILNIETVENRYGEDFVRKEDAEHLKKLHSELDTALQIILKTGTFEPGTYETSRKYSKDWEKV